MLDSITMTTNFNLAAKLLPPLGKLLLEQTDYRDEDAGKYFHNARMMQEYEVKSGMFQSLRTTMERGLDLSNKNAVVGSTYADWTHPIMPVIFATDVPLPFREGSLVAVMSPAAFTSLSKDLDSDNPPLMEGTNMVLAEVQNMDVQKGRQKASATCNLMVESPIPPKSFLEKKNGSKLGGI
eukprot:Platyproteum_vivax@DN14631_c0_g1_i1.p1